MHNVLYKAWAAGLRRRRRRRRMRKKTEKRKNEKT